MHKNLDVKYSFYKYDTTFSFDYNGNEKVYTGAVLIRNDANGGKYLYDIKSQKTSGISGISPNYPTGFSANNIPQ